MKHRYIVLLVLLFLHNVLPAQSDTTLARQQIEQVKTLIKDEGDMEKGLRLLEKSEAAFRTAQGEKPTNTTYQILSYKGKCYQLLGKYQDALAAYEKSTVYLTALGKSKSRETIPNGQKIVFEVRRYFSIKKVIKQIEIRALTIEVKFCSEGISDFNFSNV